jgi:hypothetical protein
MSDMPGCISKQSPPFRVLRFKKTPTDGRRVVTFCFINWYYSTIYSNVEHLILIYFYLTKAGTGGVFGREKATGILRGRARFLRKGKLTNYAPLVIK